MTTSIGSRNLAPVILAWKPTIPNTMNSHQETMIMVPGFNLTPLSQLHLSATAETFFESWKSLPPEANIPLTPLNTLTGCRERLEQML